MSYLSVGNFGSKSGRASALPGIDAGVTNSQTRGKYSRICPVQKEGALGLAIINTPVSFPTITKLKQAVLGIVPFAAVRTRKKAPNVRTLAVEVFCNRETHTTTAGNEKQAQCRRLFLPDFHAFIP